MRRSAVSTFALLSLIVVIISIIYRLRSFSDITGSIGLLQIVNNLMPRNDRNNAANTQKKFAEQIKEKQTELSRNNALKIAKEIHGKVRQLIPVTINKAFDEPMQMESCNEVIINKATKHLIFQSQDNGSTNLKTIRIHAQKFYEYWITLTLPQQLLLKQIDSSTGTSAFSFFEQYCFMLSVELTAVAHGAGACGEMSYLAGLQLLRNNFANDHHVESVQNWFDNINASTKGIGGHQFLVLNMNPNRNIKDLSTWGADAVILDPWNNLVVSVAKLLKFPSKPEYKVYFCTAKSEGKKILAKPSLSNPDSKKLLKEMLNIVDKDFQLARETYQVEKPRYLKILL